MSGDQKVCLQSPFSQRDLAADVSPHSESEIHTKKQMAHVARLWDLIQEQRELLWTFSCAELRLAAEERLLNLERDHSRLLSTLEESGISVPVATSADGDVMHGMGLGNAAFGSRSRDRTVTQADGGDVNGAVSETCGPILPY